MNAVQQNDFEQIKRLGTLTLSPSGKKVALVVNQPQVEGNRYLNDIWVYDPNHTPALFRLTAGEDGVAPTFLDDDTILFPGDRKKRHPKGTTVYNRISLSGGEAEEAFVLPFGASSLTPIGPDSYLVRGRRDISEPIAEDDTADCEVYDELPFWADGVGVINKIRHGLYWVNTALQTQTLLTDPSFNLLGFQVNAERTKVVYWGREFTFVDRIRSRVFIYDLRDGSRVELPLNGEYQFGTAVFVGDRIMFTATDEVPYGPSQYMDFFVAEPDGSFYKVHNPEYTFGSVGSDVTGAGCSVTSGDGFYTIQLHGFRGIYARETIEGSSEELVGNDDIYTVAAAVGKRDLVYFIGAEENGLQELYRKADGRVEKLSDFNGAYLATHAVAKAAHFVFADEEGVEMDGWILRPYDFDENKRYPAILNVHGGPKHAFCGVFSHEMQYWAAQGYVVFFCNPRGSNGKSEEFADIYGERYGVVDFNCIMKFTDQVLSRVPQIDPARVGMTGISYGGFMANWLMGHTDRFAAIVSQSGISNYLSKCLTSDIGYYWNIGALECDPWSSPAEMWKHSPLAYADKAKTPTLFLHGDKDYRCWMGDSIQLLQALLMHEVPARMVLFHNESHLLAQPRHRIRRYREMLAWFGKYMPEQA